jgi:replicative superfamily II helicase
MKMVEINPDVRIILLSATMPNTEEICGWLCTLTQRDTYFLESKSRPVPLGIHYDTYYDGDKQYQDKEMAKIATALSIVKYYSDDKFICFTHTIDTGNKLVAQLQRHKIDAEFHSSEKATADREKLQNKFKEEKDFKVVVSTSGLAWGCYRHGSAIVMADNTLKNVESIQVHDLVMSLGKDGKFIPNTVLKTGKKIVKKSIRFTLSSGEVAEVTTDHKFFAAIARFSPSWQEASKIKKGDYIAVPTSLQTNLTKVKFDRFGYIIGYILGDGCLSKCGNFADGQTKIVLDIAANKYEKKHLQWLKKLMREEFGYKFGKIRPDTNGVLHLTCKQRDVCEKLIDFIPIGRKGDKFGIVNLHGRAAIKSCLQGLFDTDGGVESHSNGNWSVGFTSISEKLIREMKLLLLTFGIKSTMGKKKMKASVINGRLQLPKRKYIWRIRIHNQNMISFQKNISFKNKNKLVALHAAIKNCSKKSASTIPVRNLLKEHADFIQIDYKQICNEFKIKSFSLENKQEITTAKIKSVLKKYNGNSLLSKIVSSNISWSRVKKIEILTGGNFQEIEVANDHNYVGEGILSHNCNFPARRVVILGIDRGLQPVKTYDIDQMAGRAGRLGLDTRGDVHILVPESSKDEVIRYLKKKEIIKSQLLENEGGHYKTLAFHVVSEIHRGHIKTKEGFHEWFSKSLAHYQDHGFDDQVIDQTIDLLQKCKCVTTLDGEYQVTALGTVASMFYYSPFDTADLKVNFGMLFHEHKDKDDYAIAMALGNLDSYRFGIVNKAEKAEMAIFQQHIESMYGSKFKEPCIKAGFAYFNLLRGVNNKVFNSLQTNLRTDLGRTMEVVGAIDSMSAKWGMANYFKDLRLRLTYGVERHLLELCQIPNVGKVRAEKLYAAKIKSIDEFINTPLDNLAVIMNLSRDKANESVEAIKIAKLKDML